MPQLFAKIKEKVFEVDIEQRWGLMKNIEVEKINARTIELHEGSKDGGLPNFHHFDGSSLFLFNVVDNIAYSFV